MTDKQKQVCLHAITHFGVEHQRRKMLEELSELAVELARVEDGRGDRDAIREELADVIVMAEQMRIVYGVKKVDDWIAFKVERLERKIHGEESNGKEG